MHRALAVVLLSIAAPGCVTANTVDDLTGPGSRFGDRRAFAAVERVLVKRDFDDETVALEMRVALEDGARRTARARGPVRRPPRRPAGFDVVIAGSSEVRVGDLVRVVGRDGRLSAPVPLTPARARTNAILYDGSGGSRCLHARLYLPPPDGRVLPAADDDILADTEPDLALHVKGPRDPRLYVLLPLAVAGTAVLDAILLPFYAPFFLLAAAKGFC